MEKKPDETRWRTDKGQTEKKMQTRQKKGSIPLPVQVKYLTTSLNFK